MAGCGGGAPSFERAAVKGKVTFDGKPLPSGTIHFVPPTGSGGQLVFAKIDQGAYALAENEGPAVGQCRVEISAERETGETEDLDGETVAVTEQYIPMKYNSESELTADIESGENTCDFEL